MQKFLLKAIIDFVMKKILFAVFFCILFSAQIFAQSASSPSSNSSASSSSQQNSANSANSQTFSAEQILQTKNISNETSLENQQISVYGEIQSKTAATMQNPQNENFYPAETVLNRIEDMKSYILKNPQEKEARKYDMETLYKILESQTYTASSKEGNLIFEVGDYDTKNQCWPVDVKFKFENSEDMWSTHCNLLYSDVLIKTFISDKQMTESQRNTYQFNVEYYDKLIRENKILYAELEYKIHHWKAAGEYRFEPLNLKIFKFEKNAQLIYSADYLNLRKSFFYIIPSIEIRNEDEILVDYMRIEQIISLEQEEQQKLNQKLLSQAIDSGEIELPKPIQRKRNSIYFSADTHFSDFSFSDFDFSKPISNIQADFSVGMNRFMFLGAQASYDLSSLNLSPAYTAGATFGLNVNLGRFIRPFVYSGGLYSSDSKLLVKLGGGFDFIFGIFMLNLSGAYNLKYDILSLSFQKESFEQVFFNPQKSICISAGLGFTWR